MVDERSAVKEKSREETCAALNACRTWREGRLRAVHNL